MKDAQKELLELSEKIEESKTKLANNEGREKEIIKSLKEVIGVESIEEAEDKLKELTDKQNKLEKEIRKSIDKLKEEYNW